ncbi:adenylate/guanylate cyclase domain-containing protein, partial [Marinilabilia sp.]|uniref:adenylate/guanylate cyclase domain-containing protein n=1 Tax=Marinilabilia sp. TaxID=2021252 RepID=UPI0025C502C0
MDNINNYIDRITHLANRNKALNAQLQNLVGRYSQIQQQNEKFNQLLTRFNETGESPSRDMLIQKQGKKVEHLRTVSLLYISIGGFDNLPKKQDQSGLIDVLDEIYIAIDKVAEEFNISKIKSFGDNLLFAA